MTHLFAIADIHLSFAVDKPMDIFGEVWRDHPRKIEAAWRESIAEEDIVLVPGDISWAMKTKDALPDLDWVASLPGQKVLLKGNHDYWWPRSRRKLEQMLPDGLHAVRRNALRLDRFAFFGVRGGDLVPLHGATALEVETRTGKELEDLEASIAELEDLVAGDSELVRIALFHYPPFLLGESRSIYTERIRSAGAELCVYGHLHDPVEFAATFQGTSEGVEYRLVSADALEFRPLLLR
jgi:hypothetical protein